MTQKYFNNGMPIDEGYLTWLSDIGNQHEASREVNNHKRRVAEGSVDRDVSLIMLFICTLVIILGEVHTLSELSQVFIVLTAVISIAVLCKSIHLVYFKDFPHKYMNAYLTEISKRRADNRTVRVIRLGGRDPAEVIEELKKI